MNDSIFYNCKVNIRTGLITTKRRTDHPGSKNKCTGYHTAMLQSKGEKHYAPYYMHRVIWEEANQCRIPKGFHVHHIDSNKSNNSIMNLSLVTQRLNNWYAAQNRDYKAIYETRKRNGFKAKIVATCAEKDGSETKLQFDSMSKCAKHFNKNVSVISNIVNHKGYCTAITLNDRVYKFCRLKNVTAPADGDKSVV